MLSGIWTQLLWGEDPCSGPLCPFPTGPTHCSEQPRTQEQKIWSWEMLVWSHCTAWGCLLLTTVTRPTWTQTLKGLFSQEQGYYLVNRMHPSSYPSCTHRTARICWARLEWWDCPEEPPGFWFALGWCLPLNTFSFVAHVTTSAAKGFPNQHPNKTRTK